MPRHVAHDSLGLYDPFGVYAGKRVVGWCKGALFGVQSDGVVWSESLLVHAKFAKGREELQKP